MKYKSFTIAKTSKKSKARIATHVYVVSFTGENGVSSTSGTLWHLHEIDGFLVAMAFMTQPVAVFLDLEHVQTRLRATYGDIPINLPA